MTYITNRGFVDSGNSSTSALNNGNAFTGTAKDVSQYPSVTVACLTDQNGTLQIQFSPDGTNWDSSLSYNVVASVNEVHRLTVTRKYFRVVLTNNSGSNQTYLRLQSTVGSQNLLTSPLNSAIANDSDAIAVRPTDFNIAVSDGKLTGANFTIKDGINFDVRSGNVPQDIWSSGGTYTGFPAAAAAAEVVIAGADTGTVYYSYMATSTDTDYTFGSVAVTGAGTYSLGHNIYRCNFAYFDNGSTVNAGTITIRHTATPANIFCIILANYGQSYCAAYTVPYNSSIYIDRISASIRGNTSTSLSGFFWYRPNGESPRLRFPFEAQYGALFFDDVDYGIRIPSLVDFVPRIMASTSATSAECKVSYRIIKIKP